MENADRAAALKLQQDGQEIAALVIENLMEAAAREGRDLRPSDMTYMLSPLLSAAWTIAKQACPGNDAEARRLYVAFLRRHADAVADLNEPLA